MTDKLFWEDPYRTTLETVVTAVDGNEIRLRETIFFAFSGGQESDAGTIAGFPVIEARKSGQAILYQLPENHGLRVDDQVCIEIDWERRYRLMRLHFAAELVLELVYRELPGVEKVGAHIAPDKARIDFRWPENISPLLVKLATQARELIARNLEIRSAYADEKTERRFWEVPEFARVPCGGTHLRRTGEVGTLQLKRNNIGKGKERIEVRLGD